jgi:hypothetical protein
VNGDTPIHMPCGCPYPKIGDHTPCVHGDCGTCDPPCVKTTPPELSLHEHRNLIRAALVAATCRELRFTGDGYTASAMVAARAGRRVRDSMPCAATYFYQLVALELRDLIDTGIESWEWCT